MGINENVGDVDFYPNGGKDQPGCLGERLKSLVKGPAEFMRRLLACSHMRSYDYFMESLLNKKCDFVGVQCNSYSDFENGLCGDFDFNSYFATMGIDADKYSHADNKTFFLKTSSKSDYCRKISLFHVSVI